MTQRKNGQCTRRAWPLRTGGQIPGPGQATFQYACMNGTEPELFLVSKWFTLDYFCFYSVSL